LGLSVLRAGSLGGIRLRVTILASGSSGNCTLLETERTRLLVDAGLGKKETLRRLAAVERLVGCLDGIVISHEHTDHIGGLAQVLGQWRTTVYLTEATHSESSAFCRRARRSAWTTWNTSARDTDLSSATSRSRRFRFPTTPSTRWVLRSARMERRSPSLPTRYLPELVKYHLRESDCLMLESNHDLEMLKVGPYPWHVKQRVMSRTGHLSNHTVSEFLADAEGFDAHARYVVLAHLSENNNNPDVARISAEEALGRRPGTALFQEN